ADEVVARFDVDACTVGEGIGAGPVCANEVALHQLVRAALNPDSCAIARNDIADGGRSPADPHPRCGRSETSEHTHCVSMGDKARGIDTDEATLDRDGVGLNVNTPTPAIVDNEALYEAPTRRPLKQKRVTQADGTIDLNKEHRVVAIYERVDAGTRL